MLKKFKKAISIFQWLLTAVLVLVVLLLIFTAFNPIKSFQIFRVMSGSMEPKIKVGSVVFVKKVKPEILKKNEVITYTSSENPEMSITHRLVEIEEKEGKTVFKTRGDANNDKDMAEVSPSQIKGKVVFSLPFLGYLSVWIKKPLGFGLLVIFPALLIIVSEILSIKKAIEKEVEKKYAERGKSKEDKPIVLLLIFFLLGISLFRIKPADAYFSDVLVIPGNTFSMASDWVSPTPSPTISPTPTPAEVVINEVEYNSVQEGMDGNYEWLELYNNTSSPITLSGWTITDNNSSDTIPDLTLPAKGFAVVAAKEVGFKTNYSSFSGLIVYISGGEVGDGLANAGDQLVLKDNTGTEIDAVSWGTDKSAFDPSVSNVDAGHSISRKEKGVDTNTATDWMDTYSGSTPPGPNPGTNPHPPDLTETTPTSSPTPSPTPEASSTPTPTVEPTLTPSPVPETSPTPTPTIEPSPTLEPTPTVEPTPAPSTTPTPSPSPTPIPSPQPSLSPESTSTPAPTSEPTPTSAPNPTSELPTYEIV
jgi:signal peptidase I